RRRQRGCPPGSLPALDLEHSSWSRSKGPPQPYRETKRTKPGGLRSVFGSRTSHRFSARSAQRTPPPPPGRWGLVPAAPVASGSSARQTNCPFLLLGKTGKPTGDFGISPATTQHKRFGLRRGSPLSTSLLSAAAPGGGN